MKLELKSKYDMNLGIISETTVENTGKKPIKIDCAILFLINETGITREQAMNDLKSKFAGKNKFRTSVLFDLDLLKEVLVQNNNSIQAANYSLKLLPYYSDDNLRLGPLEVLSATHSQIGQPSGTYSIYFCIFGKGLQSHKHWHFKKKGDDSLFRVVHDKAFVP